MKNRLLLFALLSSMAFTNCNKAMVEAEEGSTEAAWKIYEQSVAETEAAFVTSKTYKIDSIHATGAYELLSMLIAGNMRLILSDPNYPNFRHMENPSIRVGIDNPDNFYRSANIWNPDGKRVYRLWGNRGTTADFLLETFYAPDPEGAIAVLEDEEMELAENGDFEVYLSATREPYMKNWMQLEQSDKILTLIARSNYAEWDKEKHGDVFIEMVGTEGVAIPNTSKEDLNKRILNASQIMTRQGKFWPSLSFKLTLLKANSLPKFKTTGEIGVLSQKSALGYWELNDDEALVVKLKEIDAAYCGFHTFNFWGSSPNWNNKLSSLSWGRNGACQAQKTSDGFYYMVVSNQDPGVYNWIDACGMKKGCMALRLQSLKDVHLDYQPETQVVKLSELYNILPTDIKKVTPEERSEQIKARQKHALERYTYW